MNYKIGYSFDKATGRYVASERVYVEIKTGRYPCADNVVFTEPPTTREHEGAYWNGTDWELKIDDGYTEDKGNIREMTLGEKVDAGIENIPDGFKVEGDAIVPKTIDDLFDEGKLTTEEYNKKIDEQRQARYTRETDPMAMMYLRGECTKEEWVAAMDKIRAELPKK